MPLVGCYIIPVMDPKGSQRSATVWDLAGLFLVLAMVLWFTDEIARAGKVPFYRDLGPYFYPMRFNLAESLRAGELPLWNRHVAMGFPLAANIQAGAFYPPHLLFPVLSFFDAIRVLFVFHFFVAAGGIYLLCRRWNYSPYLALLGCALFTFGGVIVSLSNLLDHFQTAVWLPWVVLFAERAILGRSGKDFLLFTAVSLIQFLAGSPEIYLMSLVLLLFRSVELKAESSATSWRHVFLCIFGAQTLVIGLAMAQILPTLELFFHSWRSESIPLAKGTAWSLHPLGLLNLFFPDKEPNPYAFNGINFYFTRERPLIISLYLGAVVLPGICLWLFASSLKEKGFLSVVVGIVLILALGDHTFVYPLLLRYLPGLSMVRFPEKFLFLVSPLLLIMALRGLHRSLDEERSLPLKAWVAAGLVPLLAFVLPYVYMRFHLDTLVHFIARVRQVAPFEVSTLQISAGVLVHLERQILLTTGFFALLLLFRSGRLRTGLFGALLVALVFFDLASAHRSYLFPLSPEDISERPAILEQAQNETGRLFYIHQLSHLHPNYYRFSNRPFADTVASVFANLIPNTGVFHGFDYMQELDALGRKSYNVFLGVANNLPPDRLYRLLGVLNVKYLSSVQPLPAGKITLLRQFPEYPSWLYRINGVIPRTYIVSKVVVDQDPLKSLNRLSSSEFAPLREVILEEPLSIPPKEDFQAQARILRYANQHVTIQASLDGFGVLVLADSFYPGWRVYVDGEESKIFKANFFFRGVALSPGDHTVVFRYEPASFYYGAIVSLVSVLLLLLFSFRYLFKLSRRHA